MAEKAIQDALKKYLGVSAPRLTIGVLMLVFGILVIIFPALISWLIGLYLLISGALVVADELSRPRKLTEGTGTASQ